MAAEDDLATQWEQRWPLIVARAWADDNFKQQLTEDPMTVLRKEGFPILEGVKVAVVPQANYPGDPKNYPAATMCLTIPDRPEGLLVEDLQNLIKNAVVASLCSGTSCCC